MYVFPGEIKPCFAEVQRRLLDCLRSRLREGLATERGLARASGLSQPHVHNLLKGVRAPTVESSDALLAALDPDAAAELFRFDQPEGAATQGGPLAGVRLLNGVAGPGVRWADGWRDDRTFELPCSAVARMRDPAALRVERDPDMRLRAGVIAVDCGIDADVFASLDDIYVVVVAGCGLVRRLRPGRDCMYLAPDAALDRPSSWVRVDRETRVVARLGRNAIATQVARE